MPAARSTAGRRRLHCLQRQLAATPAAAGSAGRGVTIDLSGKVAVVTGATGQLGRVMVRTLAAAGCSVAVHYRSDEAGAINLCKEVRALGAKATAVFADVGDSNSVELMKRKIVAELGDPTIVVTNAVQQIVGGWKSVLEQDLEAYESQFRTSVLQNVVFAKAFIPGMVAAGWGRFVGINTECAMQTHETQSAYASGKRGMDAIIRVLAKEVGRHNITVNQVAPGWTVSDNDRANGNAEAESEASRNYVERNKTPMNRRGTDQEIANVVLFLASELASYVTGVYLPVCGGNEMPGI